jgi:thioredoxin reductase (NADPH)
MQEMPEERRSLVVVGAGPCGLAVGVAARQAGIDCLLLDKGAVTDALIRYPTYTTFFSGAEKLEIGEIPFTVSDDKPTRREALRYYRRVARFFELDIRQYETVESITPEEDGGLTVLSRDRTGTERRIQAERVVAATGYYDTPRSLAVPGADLPKVSYYYREPFRFFDQDVLVIGGGNSAADAALGSWREGARVTLVHLFGELDSGVKPWVRPDIDNRIVEGSIPAYWNHEVAEIRTGEVELRSVETGERTVLPNDWVLAMIGYEPKPGFLSTLGVTIDPTTGIPAHDPATMETDVPGVFIAGVIAAGYDANKIFIENGKLHGPLIARAVAGRVR